MVVLYAGGQRLGTWSEAEELFVELSKSFTIEFRDDQGNVLGKTTPPPGPIIPWDPSVTREQLDRESAEGGGMTLAEFWKKMGVE